MLEVEPQLIKTYVETGRAKLVYRHLNQLGENSVRAAEAMHCAGEQGLYWDLRYILYERQADLYTTASIEGALEFLASEAGVDLQPFKSCMSSGTHRAEVEADATAARELGIRQRPTFLVNETRLVGGKRLEDFVALLGE